VMRMVQEYPRLRPLEANGYCVQPMGQRWRKVTLAARGLRRQAERRLWKQNPQRLREDMRARGPQSRGLTPKKACSPI